MTTHTSGPYQPADTPAVASSVPDLRDTSLEALVEQSSDGTGTDPVVERVLDLEANGLLTVASFNASL